MRRIAIYVILSALATVCSIPMSAQLNGSGYYRFRNAAKTTEYISMTNDKFNFTTCISSAGGGLSQFLFSQSAAVARAMTCARGYLRTDIHMVEDAECIDPATVIYAKKKNTNTSNYEYNLIGQSTSLQTLVSGTYPGSVKFTFQDLYITIKSVSGSGANTLYYASIPLKDDSGYANMGVKYFSDIDGVFNISDDYSAQNAKWYIEPVTSFNVKPTVEHNGKYYATMYTPFAYTLSGQVLNAYVVSSIGADGVLEKVSIASTGETVPAGTPVVLECGSNVASECNLIPEGIPLFTTPDPSITEGAPAGTTATNYTGTNLLKGTYFCNTDGNISFTTKSGTSSFNANNNIAYNANKMRVFGLGSSSGKLGFFKNTNARMKANKVWLDISSYSGNANEFKFDFESEEASTEANVTTP